MRNTSSVTYKAHLRTCHIHRYIPNHLVYEKVKNVLLPVFQFTAILHAVQTKYVLFSVHFKLNKKISLSLEEKLEQACLRTLYIVYDTYVTNKLTHMRVISLIIIR